MSAKGARSESIKAPREATMRVQTVTSRGVSAFHHAFGGINAIHTDEEAAKRNSQINGVVQHGIRTLFPLVSALLERCADEPHPHLRIEAKFLAAVKVGETVTSSLQPLPAVVSDDGQAEFFEISVTNADGAKVLAGKAEIKK
jgi:acyl dehydratase